MVTLKSPQIKTVPASSNRQGQEVEAHAVHLRDEFQYHPWYGKHELSVITN